jgi:hypothetical protein
MLKFREGESRPYPFRSGRYFNINGAWYYATREARSVGPFPERAQAEAACRRHIANKLQERARGGRVANG